MTNSFLGRPSLLRVSNLRKDKSCGNTTITPRVILFLLQVAERQASERYEFALELNSKVDCVCLRDRYFAYALRSAFYA